MQYTQRFSLAILLAFMCFTSAWSDTKDSTLAEDLGALYAKSFSSVSAVPEDATKDLKAHETRPAKLAEKTQREVLFNDIFKRSPHYAWLHQQRPAILNEYAWSDLHLFYGTTSQPAHHLMSRISRTTTVLGEGALATLLATPISSIQELHHRQDILKTLLADQKAVEQLQQSLRHYQDAEQSVFSFWTPSDPLYTKEYTNYMHKYFYYAKKDEESNKSAGWLEFKKRFWRDFWDIQFNFVSPFLFYSVPPILILSKEELSEIDPVSGLSVRAMCWRYGIPYYGEWKAWQELQAKIQNTPSDKRPPKAAVNTIAGFYTAKALAYTWGVYRSINAYSQYSSVLRNLALRMGDIQAFVVAATEVSEQVAASPTLEAMYGDRLTHIRKLLDQSQEDTELGRLVYYLQTLPYQNWSYFLSNAGKLLASHKLFVACKDEFTDAMYELGELDAFISMTTLIQEAQAHNADHAYVFTQYLDRQQKAEPYVKLADMWNPSLDANVAIGNSVEMDAAPGGVRNIILTGPNAGGKSTFLTGVSTSILLSQTFGIAPAQEAIITPFDKINTSIDITDDIAAGKSLFMAEVDRAQKHLNMLTELKPNEFSFSIFDEPFSGTNPTEGAAAEYSILEAMADYTNTLNIVATHYPIVMLLEKNAPEGGFANYKVYITYEGARKRLHYTYKVVRGASNQAIAIDILEEQGYDTRLLRRAREIIEYPERYQASFE